VVLAPLEPGRTHQREQLLLVGMFADGFGIGNGSYSAVLATSRPSHGSTWKEYASSEAAGQARSDGKIQESGVATAGLRAPAMDREGSGFVGDVTQTKADG